VSTLRLPPDEFRVVRRLAKAFGYLSAADAAQALKADEIRALLAESVTVVAPGETLVIRVSDLTPNQMREYQESLTQQHEWGSLPFRCLVVYGDELGVRRAEPGDD
jgi:hypothetical protein